MNASDFVHLHVHSEYSLLSSSCRIKDLIQRTKELGQTAIALTDTGNLYGAITFYDLARENGIKPIIGCECYLAQHPLKYRYQDIISDNYRIVLLCENYQGYQNLVRLVSASNLEGFFNVPRIDFELLQKYHQGLIGLSSGTGGEIERILLSGNEEGAKNAVFKYLQLFGRDSFFLEIQDYEDDSFFQRLINLSRQTGVRCVATNDVHYVSPQDAELLRVLHCMRDNQTLKTLKHSHLFSGKWYLKSTDEMYRIFYARVPDAVSNTRIIAERCQSDFPFREMRLPKFVKEGCPDNTLYFKQLCQNGMLKRYGNQPNAEVVKRLEYEMKTIIEMGFVDYFLIVWDFIRYARSQDIPVGAGRGSGAGSLCAYCLGITQIDPIQRQLVFERFLNPERKNMPDMDVDFCIEGRQKVKDYVVRRYGSEHVAEIIAFDTLKAKAAVRDVGRVLEISRDIYKRVAQIVGFYDDIPSALKNSGELQNLYQRDPQMKQYLDTAVKIEGMVHHTSIHAAGVVISPIVLQDCIPLEKKENAVITQYTMNSLDNMGFLKMDFLGLRNLTFIRDAERSIQKQNPEFSVNQIPLDDTAVYSMIASGNTAGVFQLESAGMRGFLMRLKPENMEDIIASLALYRPGPMDAIPIYIQNRRTGKISYPHPMLKEILSTTYGCIIYQEQVMQIFQKMAGYSLGQADIVRRNMSKKKTDEMEKERQIFLYGSGENDGCIGAVANGVPLETANHIFDLMANFALYAFNKSHAAAYALLSYQTAYLKCHYFGEYMSALMSSVIQNMEKLTLYMEECKRCKLPVNPPDVNTSESRFVFRDGKLYFGLMAVKGVSDVVADKIIADRRKNGIFKGFVDFCKRVWKLGVDRKPIEKLIESGALDGLDYHRRQMLENYESILRSEHQFNSEQTEGQMSLFGEAEISSDGEWKILPTENYDTAQLLQMEKNAIGMYVSGHPLDSLQWLSRLMRMYPISEVQFWDEKHTARFFCIVQAVRQIRTKTGKEMAFLKVEDNSGSMNVTVFPELYQKCAHLLKEGAVLYLTGKMAQNEKKDFICESIQTEKDFGLLWKQMQLCIKISRQNSDTAKLDTLINVCQKFRGETELILYIVEDRKYVQCTPKIFVEISENLCRALYPIFPYEKIGLIPAIYRNF